MVAVTEQQKLWRVKTIMFIVYENAQITRHSATEVHFGRLKFASAHKKEKDALAEMDKLKSDTNRTVAIKMDAKALRATNWQAVTKLELPSSDRPYMPLKKLLYYTHDGDQLKVFCADNEFAGVPHLC